MKIFVAVIVFFILIGLIKLRLVVSYNEKEKLIVFLKIFFLKKYLYCKKNGENNIEKKRKNVVKSKKKHLDDEDKKKRNKNFLKNKKIIFSLIEPIPNLLKFLSRGFIINIFSLNWRVARQDAKDTALDYVKKISFVYNVVRIISFFCRLDKRNILVVPDYVNEKSSFNFNMDCKISIGRIFTGVFIYIFRVSFKLIFKGYLKNV